MYCGQTVGCIKIKIKLVMRVGFGPGHIFLDRDLAPLPKEAQPPILSPHLFWPNGWMDQEFKMPLGGKVGLGPSDTVRQGPRSPLPETTTLRFIFSRMCLHKLTVYMLSCLQLGVRDSGKICWQHRSPTE